MAGKLLVFLRLGPAKYTYLEWNLSPYPLLQTSLPLLRFPFFDFNEAETGNGRGNLPGIAISES